MRIWHIIIIAVLSLPFLAGAEINFPALTGQVVDEAGIIDSATEQHLETILKEHSRRTSDQAVVVTLKSLRGYEIEEFGYRLGREWKIGTKEENNGVLLIIAPYERKIRIEAGYGVEGRLTDAASKMIIENNIIPFLKEGNYSKAILKGTESIISALSSDYEETSTEEKANKIANFAKTIVIFIFFIFIILDRLMPGRRMLGRFSSSRRGFRGGGGSFGGGGASGGW